MEERWLGSWGAGLASREGGGWVALAQRRASGWGETSLLACDERGQLARLAVQQPKGAPGNGRHATFFHRNTDGAANGRHATFFTAI